MYTKYLLATPPKMVHNPSGGRALQVKNHCRLDVSIFQNFEIFGIPGAFTEPFKIFLLTVILFLHLPDDYMNLFLLSCKILSMLEKSEIALSYNDVGVVQKQMINKYRNTKSMCLQSALDYNEVVV